MAHMSRLGESKDLMLLHGGDGWGISPERDEALWRGLIAAQKAVKMRSHEKSKQGVHVNRIGVLYL